MRISTFGIVLVLVMHSPVRATDVAATPKLDVWYAAYLGGSKVGYVHTVVQEVSHEGQKILRSTMEMVLNVQREKDQVQMRMEAGTDETQDGKVTGVSMKQFLGRQQQLVMTGQVTPQGDMLHIRVDGGRRLDKRIPWNDKVIGMYQQEGIFRKYKVKPGDNFSYQSYEPTFTAVVTTQVSVKDYEEVIVFGRRRRLLRVEAVPDAIGTVQLPALIAWLDQEYQVARSEVNLPGMGQLLLCRGTQQAAMRPERAGATASFNLTEQSLVRLTARIDHPYDRSAAVYRVTVKGDPKAATAFARDDRQEIKNVRGDTFELHIRATRGPKTNSAAVAAPAEFLKSSYFINCQDPLVKQLAHKAIGREVDPWRKALQIEQFVYKYIVNKSFSEAFATADEVARTKEGDCTEHSMLAAALCRAVDIPSKTALGLVYVDHPQMGPVLGFHMWTEVWINGGWTPIDATLSRGFVGATHLKITDHSWNDTPSLAPLLPVVRVLGKLVIEVISLPSTK
jgi:hypothetical protein